MKTQQQQNKRGIPEDVIFDILVRLPVKSLCRFRCVSPIWSSTISSQHFVDSFQTRSSAHPTLLITFPNKRRLERHLFSSPTHQQKPSSPLIATHHLSLSGFDRNFVSESLNGLICIDIDHSLRICNPATREFVSFPDTKSETPGCHGYSHFRMNYFGFDPSNNEHKILQSWVIETGDPDNEFIMEHRVFVLGSYAWRRIEDGPPHYGAGDGVCVDGVLYYLAWTSKVNLLTSGTMVAFDVRLEKFRTFGLPVGSQLFKEKVVLLECEGRLGVVDYDEIEFNNIMDLWVLEDSRNGVWSERRRLVLQPSWRDIVGEEEFYIAGTMSTGEMIIAPRSLSSPCYVFYYDLKRNNVRRVEIQGLPEYEFRSSLFKNLTFTNHVESISFLADLEY